MHAPVERSDSVGRIEQAGVVHNPDADRTSRPQNLLAVFLDRTPADAPDAVREEVAS